MIGEAALPERDEPLAAAHMGPAGLYFLICVSADERQQGAESVADMWQPDGLRMRPASDAPDDAYRAFYEQLIARVQAEADEWWPHYTAVLREGSTAERLPNGRLRILRQGRHWGAEVWSTQLPYEFEGLPILDGTDEKPAIDVTPQGRLETNEPQRPAKQIPATDPAEGVLVDMGEPWQ